MKQNGLDKWLNILLIIMGGYFLVRLIDQANMIQFFPLVNNDLGSYVAQLHLLKVCGFHNFCPYWYNGFVTFLVSSPGWEFFAYPLYLLFSNILLATYISGILMYTISFVFVYYLGKSQNFSLTKTVAFFILIFANSISLGNFIVMGRMLSLNATMFFLGLAVVVYTYKNRKLDKNFVLFFVSFNVLVILAHYQEAILAQILILCLFIIKKGYEKIILVLSYGLSLILSAFWWFPFLIESLNSNQSSILTYEQGKWFAYQIIPKIEFTTRFFNSILIIIIPIILFIAFYFYWSSKNKSRQELLFYSPVVILNFLFLFRYTAYIPFLRHISPDPFLMFFLFFILIFFLKTNYYYSKILRLAIIFLIISIPVANVVISHKYTPYSNIFEYGPIEKETLSILEAVNQNEKFVFASHPPATYAPTFPAYYYAYATIYLNLSTPEGYYYTIVSRDYMRGINIIREETNCEKIKGIMMDYNALQAIAYGEKCKLLKTCGYKEIMTKSSVCLYRLE